MLRSNKFIIKVVLLGKAKYFSFYNKIRVGKTAILKQ